MSGVYRQLSALFDLFFPPACPVCLSSLSSSADPFCSACSATIVPLPTGRCSCCALPFPNANSSRHLCVDCCRQAPSFSAVFAAGLYEGALKNALHRFKYSAIVDLDRPLAGLLQNALPPLSGNEIILPVPLHPRRLRRRSYNQSLLLARVLAHNLQIELDSSILERVVDSLSQQGLGAQQRASNLRGAFQCTRRLDGETFLLIDDVMTTGATVAVCSQALLDAGAGQVLVGAVARAPRHQL